MTLLTLGKYLIGDRGAILQIAGSRQALWLGLIFVLAAGFAREYDGEDLLHEPWHLLVPLGASLVSSAVLYLLVRFVAWLRGAKEPGVVSGYLDFLGLYWLTAPLALLYAIPVERLLSAGAAMQANLWLLALVSLWRVLLMARVVAVLYGSGFFSSLFVVLLFGDTVALTVLNFTPLPILAIMGGVRLSPSEQVLLNTSLMVRVLGTLSWPVWLIGTAIVAFPTGIRWQYQAAAVAPPLIARHLWACASAALAIWILILPLTQPAQQLRRQVERDLRAERIREALATMSAHNRDDFPPHWDPPPRMGYGETVPSVSTIVEHLNEVPVNAWVGAIYVEKFSETLGLNNEYLRWRFLSTGEIDHHLGMIETFADRDNFVREYQDSFKRLLSDGLSDDVNARLRKLLDQAGVSHADIPQRNPVVQD